MPSCFNWYLFRRPSLVPFGRPLTETTIAVAETARRDIHWLHPMDLHTETMSYQVNSGPLSISSSRPGGPLVLFCDGAVFQLQSSIPEATLRAMLTINGGERLDRAELIHDGFLRPVED